MTRVPLSANIFLGWIAYSLSNNEPFSTAAASREGESPLSVKASLVTPEVSLNKERELECPVGSK